MEERNSGKIDTSKEVWADIGERDMSPPREEEDNLLRRGFEFDGPFPTHPSIRRTKDSDLWNIFKPDTKNIASDQSSVASGKSRKDRSLNRKKRRKRRHLMHFHHLHHHHHASNPDEGITSIFQCRNRLLQDQNGRRRFLTLGLNYECNIFHQLSDCFTYLKKSLTSRIDPKDSPPGMKKRSDRKSTKSGQPTKKKRHHRHHHRPELLEPFWIDIQSPTKRDMKAIQKFFKLHELTTEDCLDNDSGEKMELFPNYLFVCVRNFDKTLLNQFEELNIIVFKRFVITVHRGYFEELDLVLKRIETALDSGLTENQDGLRYLHNFIKRSQSQTPPLHAHSHSHSARRKGRHHHQQHSPLVNRTNLMSPPRKKKNKANKKRTQEERERMKLESVKRKRMSTLTDTEKVFKRPRIPHSSWILYAFMDVMTDMYVPLTEKLLLEVETLDEHVLMDESKKTSYDKKRSISIGLGYQPEIDVRDYKSRTELVRQLALTQKRINQLKKLLITKQSIVQLLMSNNTERFITDSTLVYLRDVVDHLKQCLGHLESAKESSKQVHSNYMTRVSIEIAKSSSRTDALMNKIELFIALFTPVACVAGAWGMNMPVPFQFSDTNRTMSYFYWVLGVSFFISFMTVFCLNPYLFDQIASRCWDILTCQCFFPRKKSQGEENRVFFSEE